jgi:hypothetical protein
MYMYVLVVLYIYIYICIGGIIHIYIYNYDYNHLAGLYSWNAHENVWQHLSESEALKTFHAEGRWKLRSEILATASPCATCGVKWVACEDSTKNHRRYIYIYLSLSTH